MKKKSIICTRLRKENCKAVSAALRCDLKWRAVAPSIYQQFLLSQFAIVPNLLYALDGGGQYGSPIRDCRSGERGSAVVSAIFAGLSDAADDSRRYFRTTRKRGCVAVLSVPVVGFDFVRSVVFDVNVVAIKQTIYRTGMNAPT